MPPTEQSNKTYQPPRLHHHQNSEKIHDVALKEQQFNNLYINKNLGLSLAKRLLQQSIKDQIKNEYCDNTYDDENNNYRFTRNIREFIADQLNTKEEINEIKSEVEDDQPMDIDVVGTDDCNLNLCQPIRRETIQVAQNLVYQSDDAVRFGRVPKNEKDRISHAMKAAAQTQNKMNEHTAYTYKEHVASYYREPSLQVHNLVALIIRQAEMHAETISGDFEKTITEMRLYDKDMRQILEHAVSRIVIFAKNLPGFEAVQQPDQITLLRACVVEISLIHLACMTNTKCEKIIAISGYIIFACVYDGCFTSSPAISKAINGFVQRLKNTRLESSDVALLSAAALVNPRRDTLIEVGKIRDLNEKIVHFLSTSSSIPSEEISAILHEISSIYMDPNVTRSTECSDPRYIPEERKMETSSPTSTLDEEMSPPGSAESGCSTDSAGSNDSGIGMESGRSLDVAYSNLSHQNNGDEIMEISDDHTPAVSKSWHNPTYLNETKKNSVLMKALQLPSRLTLPNFNKMVNEGEFHQHKKFRRQTNNLSPSYNSCSPSPSSSLSSSPSRVSSSPYSSPNPSSPAISTSILAQRLSCPMKNNPKGALLQTLSQEPKFTKKARLSDSIHSAIMNGESRVPTSRQHVLATPSPSRHDSVSRTSSPGHLVMSPCNSMASSPVSHMSSPPHNYSSPVTTHLNSPFSSGPTGLGASAMSGCNSFYEDAQPLNLSTKTPPPTAAIF